MVSQEDQQQQSSQNVLGGGLLCGTYFIHTGPTHTQTRQPSSATVQNIIWRAEYNLEGTGIADSDSDSPLFLSFVSIQKGCYDVAVKLHTVARPLAHTHNTSQRCARQIELCCDDPAYPVARARPPNSQTARQPNFESSSRIPSKAAELGNEVGFSFPHSQSPSPTLGAPSRTPLSPLLQTEVPHLAPSRILWSN
jgi:hypothetical protein